MPLYINDFINILAELNEIKDLKATGKQSVKGGILTGCAAFVGGLLLGPIGLAVGGALGGGACAIAAQNSFKSVPHILMSMTPNQKERLYNKIRFAFRDFGITDLAMMSTLLLSNSDLQTVAISALKDYLSSEMNLRITT